MFAFGVKFRRLLFGRATSVFSDGFHLTDTREKKTLYRGVSTYTSTPPRCVLPLKTMTAILDRLLYYFKFTVAFFATKSERREIYSTDTHKVNIVKNTSMY